MTSPQPGFLNAFKKGRHGDRCQFGKWGMRAGVRPALTRGGAGMTGC